MKITTLLTGTVTLMAALTMTGCLKTRSEVKEVQTQQVMSQQVTTLQKETADAGTKYQDLNEEIRDLRGRVEVFENQNKTGGSEAEKTAKALAEQNAELARRFALLQETASKNDAQIQAMNADMMALRAELAAARAGAAVSAGKDVSISANPGGKKTTWDSGMEHFENKDWKKAILSFQDYREKNPKGKNIAEATYRMGVCFQELGLKDEARTFYEEAIGKYPNSPEAKKARTRLKSLKK